MADRKPNRNRNINFHICLNDEELELLKDRMKRAGMSNMGAYLRKMGINGYHVNLDLTDVKELVSLLRRCSNNLNQVAKLANTTHNIYEADIKDLQIQLEKLWCAANSIMQSLAKIK